MTNTATFLVELGTEELPPKSLRALAEAFAQNLQANITQAELGFEQLKWFASPRRLAVQITSLSLKQPDRQIEKRGPAIAQAFNADGQATPAAIGWAKGCGITVEEADRIKTDKGEWLIHYANVQGAKTIELISEMVKQALAKLPIPKLMRWGDKETQFVRPVHTLTMLLDSELVEGEMLGLSSGRTVRGHRFMGEAQFELDHAEHYVEQLLSRGKVMVDYEQRKAKIKQDAMHAAEQIGGIADISESLLEEVTSLVEWPVVLTAKFEEKFLAVPSEALVHTMKGDQKYFPVYQKSSAIESTESTAHASSQFGQLMPNFIFVTNIESKDPSQIISGNEKVVRPRLSDAEFFFNTDRKEKLIDRLPRLANVLFQQQLGTLFDRTQRIADLSKGIAELIGANPEHAHRAGLLAKCDLLTNMVFEFTETQGVMGMHYARFDGEPEDVAVAINEQYQPRFSGDALPQSLVACSVAIAEKMDTLVGIFGIGQHPKGDKDPFALRRAALGVLRIIVEKQLPLDLTVLAQKSADSYGEKLTNPNTVEEVVDFMLGRFRTWYQDAGFAVDTIHAVLARRPTSPVDFDQRMKAVTHFRTLDAAATLAAANKRVSNILAKVESSISDEPQASLYKAGEELRLATHIVVLKEALEPLFAENNYQEALTQLAELRQNVDEFFDNVIVMDEDLVIRANRLSLLNQLRNLFLRVADISLLQ